MLGHPGHGQRVQGLQQERTDAPDQHGGEIGMHHPGHPIGWEVGLGGINRHRYGCLAEPDGPAHTLGQIDPGRRGQIRQDAPRNVGHGSTQGGGIHDRVEGGHP
jgi:hypothetical protein